MDTENSTPQANTTTEDAVELAMLRADRADDHATMQVMRETIARRTDTLHLLEAQRDELLAALNTATDQLTALMSVYQFTEGDDGVTQHVIDRAEDAIAKAEGGAQ